MADEVKETVPQEKESVTEKVTDSDLSSAWEQAQTGEKEETKEQETQEHTLS